MRSPGDIGDGQRSRLEVTLDTAAGQVQFARMVSSEAGFDYLRFSIDGVDQGGWSGEDAGFKNESFPVSAGTHTFAWTYQKDGSVSAGRTPPSSTLSCFRSSPIRRTGIASR